MATITQIDALKSTGPNTPDGEAGVSLNALRHGMRASTLVLPQEDLGSFQNLCDLLDAEWQPQTPSERFYCEQMTICQWKLIRIEGVEAGAYRSEWGVTKFLLPFLDITWKAQNRMERSYARAQHELQALQKSRLNRESQTEPQPQGAVKPTPITVTPEPPPSDVERTVRLSSRRVSAKSSKTQSEGQSPSALYTLT